MTEVHPFEVLESVWSETALESRLKKYSSGTSWLLFFKVCSCFKLLKGIKQLRVMWEIF